MSFKRFLLGAAVVAASFIPGVNIAIGMGMTLSGILFSAGISVAAGGILAAFADPLEQKQRNVRDNPISPTSPLPAIYGQQRVGVSWVDIRSVNDNVAYFVGAVCLGSEDGSGVEDITEIWFDDVRAVNTPTTDGTLGTTNLIATYTGVVEYSVHLGTNAQPPDATLASVFPSQWPSTSDGAGIAYIVLKLTYDQDKLPTFPNVSVTVKGQKVYDPRTATTAYSNNPALCVLDYLTSEKYGCGVALADVDTASFEDSANFCDATVNTTAYNGVRFTCTGVVDTSEPRREVIEQLLSSCRGQIIYEGGVYRLYINQVETPTTFELNESNTLGEWEFARLGNVPNSVTCSYIDATEFQVREITWPEAGAANSFLTADNNYPVHATMQLPFTSNVYIAQQIGMVTLRERREDIVIGLRAQEEAMKLQIGDVVPVTHSTAGFSAKSFRVQTMAILPDCTVQLVLREYDAAAYTLDTQNTQDTGTDTTLANALTCIAPTSLVLTSSTSQVLTHAALAQPRVAVSWTASTDAFLSYYEVQYKKVADSAYIALPDVPRDETSTITPPLADDSNYDIRVRAVNTLGVASTWLEGVAALVPTIRTWKITIDDKGAVKVDWTVSPTTLGILIDMHNINDDIVYQQMVDASLGTTTFPASEAYGSYVNVAIQPWSGFSAGSVSGTNGTTLTETVPTDSWVQEDADGIYHVGKVLDFGGGKLNARVHDSLAASLTHIGATDTVLELPVGMTRTLTANTTIPSNVTLDPKGGTIVTGAFTLTINGPILPCHYNPFDTSGGGGVVFGGAHVRVPRGAAFFDTSAPGTAFRVTSEAAGGASTNHGSIHELTQQSASTVANVGLIGTMRYTHASGTATSVGMGVEGFGYLDGAGTASSIRGVVGIAHLEGNGTITEAIGLLAAITKLGGSTGAITTAYGIKVADITDGATNYAIYTGSGLVRFGGAVTAATIDQLATLTGATLNGAAPSLGASDALSLTINGTSYLIPLHTA